MSTVKCRVTHCQTQLLQSGATWFSLKARGTRYHVFAGSTERPFVRAELFKESPKGLVNIPVKTVAITMTLSRLKLGQLATPFKTPKAVATLEWTT